MTTPRDDTPTRLESAAASLLRSQAAEIERLKAELGDLPEAQADMLRTIKELRAEAELFAKHVGIKLARKDALLRECLTVISASYAEHYDEAFELRIEANIKEELGESP